MAISSNAEEPYRTKNIDCFEGSLLALSDRCVLLGFFVCLLGIRVFDDDLAAYDRHDRSALHRNSAHDARDGELDYTSV